LAPFGKVNILEYLLGLGLDINVNAGIAGGTPLLRAASEGRLDAVKYLLAKGAVLDVSKPERNPLFGAITGGHTEIARLLIEAGIDTQVQYIISPTRKKTALSHARERGQQQIAAMLPGDVSSPLASGDASPHDEIISHMTKNFGPVQMLGLNEILPAANVRINFVTRSPDDPVVLFTTGMSDYPNNVPPGMEAYTYTELLIRLPSDWPTDNRILKPKYYWPVQWLKQIARLPRENNTWIGDRLTIVSNEEPPKPLAKNLKMTCMMVLREPNLLNPILMNDGRKVLLYSLTPLYTEERDFERQKGMAALLAQFDKHKVSQVVDVNRANTVAGV
jgi:hypothetical protein